MRVNEHCEQTGNKAENQNATGISKVFVVLLSIYQYFISPLLGERCRFLPNCSEYAKTAILEHGVWVGSWLTLKRLSRCHPFHAGGYDPVPSKINNKGEEL